jgi:hypothetical protein
MRLLDRGVAVAAAAGCVASLFVSGPAGAASTTCVALPVSTPSLGADLDGDGADDVRVPGVSEASLCVGADVVLGGLPTIEREQCGGFGSCMTYYVSYALTGYADVGATFCYTAGGVQTCAATDLPRIPLDFLSPRRICTGWDLRGGFPCPSGQPIEIE